MWEGKNSNRADLSSQLERVCGARAINWGKNTISFYPQKLLCTSQAPVDSLSLGLAQEVPDANDLEEGIA